MTESRKSMIEGIGGDRKVGRQFWRVMEGKWRQAER
jgi:hypothetical protein